MAVTLRADRIKAGWAIGTDDEKLVFVRDSRPCRVHEGGWMLTLWFPCEGAWSLDEVCVAADKTFTVRVN